MGGRPVVVVCRLSLQQLRRQFGDKAVRCRGPMVAVRGIIQPRAVAEVLRLPGPARRQSEPVLTAGEVFELLDSSSPRMRMMGVMMLATQRSAEAFDWLCTRLEDADPRVRLAVAMALRRRGIEATDVLDDMRGDADPRVRHAAETAMQA